MLSLCDDKKGQFEYKKVLAHGLLIGSDVIESEYRYVIQDRPKLSGAWWKSESAHNMPTLRALRANSQ